MQEYKIQFIAYPANSENCVGCRMCVDSCPNYALSAKLNTVLEIYLNPEDCYGCGVCVDVCPFDVLRIIRRDKIKEFRIEKNILKLKDEQKRYFEIIKVIESGLCCGCGACTVCPPNGIIWNDGTISFPEWSRACRDCAICIKVCQRYNFEHGFRIPSMCFGDPLS